ncbi:AI-2E family transporter [Chryseolinea lacunae]|uniref:AI-2E family transporter n=1 Tax=Chryseolinea lacunae TaxID=2801331 RepID=A0ABS1KUT2_9BACT|nr:AI-2E family transporter [Chryseolinea lacunae]MBL0743105.1 AI-2E family transporter [Chryseolinea lacunae]
MNENKYLTNATHAVLLILGVLALMIVGQKLFIPLTWAFLFSFVLHPFCRFLEKHRFGRTTASLTAVLVFCFVSGFILIYLIYEAVRILENEPVLYSKMKEQITALLAKFQEATGVALYDPQAESNSSSEPLMKALPWVAKQVSSIGENLVTVLLVPIYLFFMLTFRGTIKRFVRHRFEQEHLDFLSLLLKNSRNAVQSYLNGTLVLTALVALVTFIILLSLGIRHAFFFSVFYAILSLIPYIGHLIAFIIIIVFAWVTKDSGLSVILVAVALYVVNVSQENFLRPKLIGNKMEMNSMVVFSAVVVGGMIWGLSGMVLFIPLLGVLKAITVSHGSLKSYTTLFEP